MSELKIPAAKEMLAFTKKNENARREREQAAQPARFEQWMKRVAEELQSCQRTEVRSVSVTAPPIPDDWDPHLVWVVDTYVRDQVSKALTPLGYEVREERSADYQNRWLHISWDPERD